LVVKAAEVVQKAAAGLELNFVCFMNIGLQVFEEGHKAVLVGDALQEAIFVDSLLVKIWLEAFVEYKRYFIEVLHLVCFWIVHYALAYLIHNIFHLKVKFGLVFATIF